MELTVENLSFSYPNSRLLFDNISFSVMPGEIVTILGPNGVGKTTLLNCLANLDKPTKGRILLGGNDMQSIPPREIAASVGFVPQLIVPTFAYEVMDYVVTGCAPRLGAFERPKAAHYDIAKAAIEKMGISHLSYKYYTQISGGERQQVSIARVLAQKPQIILMDEPTAHLDYGNQIRVLKIIKELKKEGYAVILTTHNPDHALLLQEKAAVIDLNGEFTFGDCNDILTETFLRSLYNTDISLKSIGGLGRNICVIPELD